MANDQLDAFLAEGAEAAGASAPAETPPAPAPSTGEPEAKAAPSKATPETEEAEPPSALEGEPIVPRRAYEDERRKRQDWKEKAARYEGENAELRRQMEEATRRAAAPPPQQQYVPPPVDPNVDLAGYLQQQEYRRQQELINERLNNSEERLTDKIGEEKVSEYVSEFRKLVGADPALYDKLISQRHPYGWMQREVDRQRLLKDVGDDPAAFRAKVEAEARAKWEAEAAQRAPAPSPAVGMQPSLATARSVAGRSAPTWTGEPSLDEVLAPVQNRKNANGTMRRF